MRNFSQPPLPDDSRHPLDELWTEIELRFGICPSLFKLAQPDPAIARHMFRTAELAYLDNPMPAALKERLFTWLSRLCDVRYSVARHSATLLAQGVREEQVLSLLDEPMPSREEVPAYLSALEHAPYPLNDSPSFDSELGRRFRVACAVTILEPGHAGQWLQALRGILGPLRYEQVLFFLAFVRTEHFWVRVHPELEFEPDLMALLREHPALAETMVRNTGEADRWGLGRQLYDELQSLRRSQDSNRAILDSEARFRAIFENAAVGISRVALDGRFLEVNQRLCDIVGYERGELMSKTFTEITHPDDLEADWTAARGLLTGEMVNKLWLDFTGRPMEMELGNGWLTGIHPDDLNGCRETYVTHFDARKSFKMEYRLRRFDGEFCWVLDNGVPRFSAGGDFQGYIGTCIDITERRRAELEREQLSQAQAARAVAEAANRSKDEFLAMVSHELRSPLNAILGYARMLRSGPAEREAIDKATGVIERNAKAQLQIIEDLLDSARIVTGKLRIEPGPVDLVPVLEAALDTVSAAASAKGVILVANFAPQPEEVLGDSTRLQQIVWNLLSNAVKFTSAGGRVELRMEHDAGNIRITVSDNGKGIEPEFLPYVFESFRQADASSARRFGGLGLGLSLVKHLVELHGGTITAASESGGGSTFTVTLPRRQPEFHAPPPAVVQREVRTEGAIVLEQALSLEGVNVLVVDDQEEARVVLTQTLSEYGARGDLRIIRVRSYSPTRYGGRQPS